MKRRQAIRQIVIVSSGLALLPSCDFQSAAKTFKTYQHLPLEKGQYELIEGVQAAIFPMENMPVSDTETPLDYMLTRINDCYSMEDIKKYLGGLNDFQKQVSDTFNKPFEKLNSEQKIEALNTLSADKTTSEPMQVFIQTNKKLTVEYFTQSEEYQVNHFGFEFMPSRYVGCVSS